MPMTKEEVINQVPEDLKPVAEVYFSGRNPKATKKLMDNSTNWIEVLTKYKDTQGYKNKARESKPKPTIYTPIEDAIKLADYNALKEIARNLARLGELVSQSMESAKAKRIEQLDDIIKQAQEQKEELEKE